MEDLRESVDAVKNPSGTALIEGIIGSTRAAETDDDPWGAFEAMGGIRELSHLSRDQDVAR